MATRGKGKSGGSSGAGVPTEQEIAKLPRWARVAFAARCARRVQPLFKHLWPEAPGQHVIALESAITLAERSAAASAADHSAADAVAAADASSSAAARAAANPLAAARAAGAAAAAARAAAYAAYAANDARAGTAARAAARAADAYAAVVIQSIRADFEILRSAAKAGKWNDDTPVPPDVFGPMWPDGAPEGWPQESPDHRLALRVYLGEFVDVDEVSEKLLDLIRAMNAYHIASGGSGLEIEDWQMFEPAGEPAEVLT